RDRGDRALPRVRRQLVLHGAVAVAERRPLHRLMTVESRELSVRGTSIQLLTAGAGPALLFLHGGGGAGRWLPFQELLARRVTVFHNPMAALALAPPDQSVETLALQYRQGTAVARVSWNPHLYDPALRRRLARITAPTLLCWGAHDRLAPRTPCGEAWATEIPGARLRVFADSGHAPHLEEPAAVAEAVIEFCRPGAARS